MSRDLLSAEEIEAINNSCKRHQMSYDSYLNDLYIARNIAFSLLNTPYLWGGDNPLAGLDCSGIVIEILKSVGLLPARGDWTAQGLFDRFLTRQIAEESVCEGCLIFWQNAQGKTNHVEYALNPHVSIGARGDSTVKDKGSAIKQGAYVKIRPWKNRQGRNIRGFVNPFL